MNKNRQFAMFILMLLLSSLTFGQKIGVRLGASLADISYKSDGEDYNSDLKTRVGFHAGVFGEMPLSDNLAFELGLILNQKGYRLSESDSEDGYDYSYSGSASVIYADIPLNIKYYHELDNDLSVFGTFGPYVGAGILGKTKFKYTSNGKSDSDSEKIVFGNDDDSDFKRLDYGLGVGVGIAKENLQLGINYNFGLANIAPGGDADNKFSNRVLGISLNYFLK
ncbi:MAG: PorT family protein [Bacteroidetes bacterium]|nr:PorT family protein [Bacteroidota bacterium]